MSEQDELVFIDCEASGLHSTSYPIEVGWCSLNLKPLSLLIKPHISWSEWDWSFESQKIHGISRDECLHRGLDVVRVAEVLNMELRGKVVLSDAPAFDGGWIARLYDAAQVAPAFSLRLEAAMRHIRDALDPRGEDLMDLELRLARVVPRPHRAAADALYLASLWRCAHEPGFIDELEKGAPL